MRVRPRSRSASAGPILAGDHHLRSAVASLAFDAGAALKRLPAYMSGPAEPAVPAPTIDIEGDARPAIGGGGDIGADERQPVVCAGSSTDTPLYLCP